MKLKRGKIHSQQRRTMRSAGFKLSSVDLSMVVWRRGDIRVGLNPSRQVTLKDLIGRVIRQAEYWTQRKAQIAYGTVEDWTPEKDKT